MQERASDRALPPRWHPLIDHPGRDADRRSLVLHQTPAGNPWHVSYPDHRPMQRWHHHETHPASLWTAHRNRQIQLPDEHHLQQHWQYENRRQPISQLLRQTERSFDVWDWALATPRLSLVRELTSGCVFRFTPASNPTETQVSTHLQQKTEPAHLCTHPRSTTTKSCQRTGSGRRQSIGVTSGTLPSSE